MSRPQSIDNSIVANVSLCWIAARPMLIFLLLSALFGPLTILMTLPFRGPDELPHFIRAYGLSTGEVVPWTVDDQGRKGVWLPAKLDQEIKLYNEALRPLYEDNTFTPREVVERYTRARSVSTAPLAKVFVRYAGSEGYSPIPYLPYLPALAVTHFMDLDLVSTIYLMRAVGFIILTALIALAIFLVPNLSWPFVLITFLPSALFSRAVLSADGAALAFTMLVTAAALRVVATVQGVGPQTRSLFMALCVLSKPPQLAFIFLEAIRAPLNYLVREWKITLIVIVPSLVLSLAWVAVSSADVAAWRLLDGGSLPPESYQPLWRLRYLLEHPLHFITLLVGTYDYLDDYWLQLVGILGWLDMPLRVWLYPLLTGFFMLGFCVRLELDPKSRRRIVAIGTLTTGVYILGIFFIFYLVWTGLDQTKVQGVQGRYFVVLLPTVAMIIAASAKRGFSCTRQATIAILGGILSGWATLDAIARSDWKFPLLPF